LDGARYQRSSGVNTLHQGACKISQSLDPDG
jgi:hypothetical protein